MKKLLTFIGVLFLLYWGICILVDAVVVLKAGVLWTILSCVIGGIGLACFVVSFYPPLKKGALIGDFGFYRLYPIPSFCTGVVESPSTDGLFRIRWPVG